MARRRGVSYIYKFPVTHVAECWVTVWKLTDDNEFQYAFGPRRRTREACLRDVKYNWRDKLAYIVHIIPRTGRDAKRFRRSRVGY